jgi:hypothetical protein
MVVFLKNLPSMALINANYAFGCTYTDALCRNLCIILILCQEMMSVDSHSNPFNSALDLFLSLVVSKKYHEYLYKVNPIDFASLSAVKISVFPHF